jgi:glutamate dehydrogenase (NAD(P)+)
LHNWKTEANHGVSGRVEATGKGIYYLIRNLSLNDRYKGFRKQGKLLKGLRKKKIVVQGFGAVGYHAAQFLQDHGSMVVGVCGEGWSIQNESGLDCAAVLAASRAYDESADVKAFEGLGELSLDDSALYARCDFLIPAAVELTINKTNVHKIRAKVVVEGANGAISVDADKFLQDKGTLIIPDIIAGTGGLISSYYEYLSNIDRRKLHDLITKWEEKSKVSMLMMLDRMFEKTKFNFSLSDELKSSFLQGPQEKDLHNGTIENIIGEALDRVMLVSEKENLDLRTAAYNLAITKINKQTDHIGLII